MERPIKIFFSWQSDTDPEKAKHLILRTLRKIKSDYRRSVQIEIIEDMRGAIGSEQIEDHVIKGIESCDIFVADLTVVGGYTKETNPSKAKTLPNPNVLYELGYAVKTLSWDHVICVLNTDYGEIETLPFDINHISMLPFKSTQLEDGELKSLLTAVRKQIDNYCNGTFTFRNLPFKVGNYDYEEKRIQSDLKVKDISGPFKNIQQSFINESKKIYTSIVNLNKTYNFSQKSQQSSPSYSRETTSVLSSRLGQNRVPYSFEKESKDDITAFLEKYYSISVTDPFFDLGNLTSPMVVVATEGGEHPVNGDAECLKKLRLLQDLEQKICDINNNELIYQQLSNFCFVPISIRNISGKFDEDIDVTISASKGILAPLTSVFEGGLEFLCDYMYSTKILESIFVLSEEPEISSLISYPSLNLMYGIGGEKQIEYKDFLNDYVSGFITDAKDDYVVLHVESLRANECAWCPCFVAINSSKEPIELTVRIKSNSSSGTFEQKLKISK